MAAANTLAKLLGALPEPMSQEVEGFNSSTGVNVKLAEVFQTYFDEWETAIADVGLQRYDQTALGDGLNGKLALYGYSNAGESLTDAEKRLAIGRKKAKLWGATTYDEMLSLIVALAGVDGTQVTVRENMKEYPSTEFESGVIEFILSSAAMEAAGIPVADLDDAIASLAVDMGDAAAAGVRVRITLTGGAVYGTSLYDAPTTVYST